MAERTLDQVTELAFCEHLTPDEAARLPEVLPHARYRKAWQAAAEAAVKESRTDKLHAAALSALAHGEMALAEQAVIQAAQTRQRYLETHPHRVCHGTENTLFAAVEALEALKALKARKG